MPFDNVQPGHGLDLSTFIEHKGGPMPVAKGTPISIIDRDGTIWIDVRAGDMTNTSVHWDWSEIITDDHIVGYRVELAGAIPDVWLDGVWVSDT